MRNGRLEAAVFMDVPRAPLLALLLLVCACRSESRRATISAGAKPRAAAAMAYFPDDTFEPTGRAILVDWYSRQLTGLKEPPLLDVVADESLRFTLLRTWDPPVVVRVSKRGSDFELVAKRGNGESGFDPGEVVVERKIEIDAEDWSLLQRAVTQASYDTLGPQPADEMLNDGSTWLVEHVVNGKYRLVQRWDVSVDGPHAKFRALCDRFVQLAGPGLVLSARY